MPPAARASCSAMGIWLTSSPSLLPWVVARLLLCRLCTCRRSTIRLWAHSHGAVGFPLKCRGFKCLHARYFAHAGETTGLSIREAISRSEVLFSRGRRRGRVAEAPNRTRGGPSIQSGPVAAFNCHSGPDILIGVSKSADKRQARARAEHACTGTDSPCPLTDHYKWGPDRGMRFGRRALFDQMAH